MRDFECKKCGQCCGPVPLTKQEFLAVKKEIAKMPQEKRRALKNQMKGKLTCVLLDENSKCCSVYDSRPLVCRQYGQIKELQCPNNKGLKLKSGRKEVASINPFVVAGILSMTIGWKELESDK